LLIAISKRETGTRYGKSGTAGRVCRESGTGKRWTAWRVPGKRFCGPGVDWKKPHPSRNASKRGSR